MRLSLRYVQNSIQFEWRSDVVEFHVAGPEEEVTRALHLIKEEFKVCFPLCCIT